MTKYKKTHIKGIKGFVIESLQHRELAKYYERWKLQATWKELTEYGLPFQSES